MANRLLARRRQLTLPDRIFDGYRYMFGREYGRTRYMICQEQLLTNCRARGKLVGDEFQLIRGHNHVPDENSYFEAVFIRQLYSATTTQFRSVHSIYDELRVLYPEVAASLTWTRVRNGMHRWRRLMTFPPLISIENLRDMWSSRRYNKIGYHERGILSAQFITINGTICAVAFGDLQFQNLLPRDSKIYIGLTTRNAPEDIHAKQILTFTVGYEDYAFPCGWVLLTNREAISSSIDHIFTSFFPNSAPQAIIYDYESRINNSLSIIFPEDNIQGSFLAYCNVLVIEAAKRNITVHGITGIIFRKLVSLCLLPANKITEGFVWLYKILTAEMRIIFNDLFNYYLNVWIKEVGPEKISCFNNLGRLVNCNESNWENLNHFVGSNPTTWRFLGQLIRIQNQTVKDFQRLRERRRITCTPRIREVLNKVAIRRIWGMIETHTIGTPRFLAIASNLLQRTIFDLHHRNIPEDLEFRPLQNNNDINLTLNEIEQEPDAHLLFEEYRLQDIHHDIDGELPPVNWLEPEDENLDEEVHADDPIHQDDNNMAVPVPINRILYYVPECVVCRCESSQKIFLPCHHIVTCTECCDNLRARAAELRVQWTCPVCRAPVEEMENHIPLQN